MSELVKALLRWLLMAVLLASGAAWLLAPGAA